MDWFRSLPEYRRKIFLLLIVAILLTLPCYCIGLALLILAPEETAPPPAAPAGSVISGEAMSLWPAAPGAGLATVEPVKSWLERVLRETRALWLPRQAGLGTHQPAAP
jgi:hypothetical protein